MSLTIPRRLALLVAVSALVSLVAMLTQLFSLRSSMMEERQVAIAAQVEAATSIVKAIGAEAEAGRLTKAEAQQRAAAGPVHSLRQGRILHRL